MKRLRGTSAEGHKATVFKEGDLVMLYRPKVRTDESLKLSHHWFGPYTVDKLRNNGKVVYLKDHLGDPLRYLVSVNLLKPIFLHNPSIILSLMRMTLMWKSMFLLKRMLKK